MKALHPVGKRRIFRKVRRVFARLSTSSPTSSIVPNPSLGSSEGVDSWVPQTVKRRAWVKAQHQQSRAIHLKRIQRIDL